VKLRPWRLGGSALNIMKYSHPTGLDEASIATILKEVLKAGACNRENCLKAGPALKLEAPGTLVAALPS
jgi:hypothetical protein